MVRILLADDHDVVRRGLKALLQEHAGWEICGEAMTGREAVDLAREMQLDVAIIDLTMPDLNGLGVTSQIRKVSERTQVLIDGPSADHPLVVRARLASQAPEIDAAVYLTECDPSSFGPGTFAEVEIVGARDYDLLARPVL